MYSKCDYTLFNGGVEYGFYNVTTYRQVPGTQGSPPDIGKKLQLTKPKPW